MISIMAVVPSYCLMDFLLSLCQYKSNIQIPFIKQIDAAVISRCILFNCNIKNDTIKLLKKIRYFYTHKVELFI